MPAQVHYNDGGTWRKAKQVHYNDNGTWRTAKQIWYNDAGTWRQVFASDGPVADLGVINLSDFASYPAAANAEVEFRPDGTLAYINGSGPTNWYTPTTAAVGANYWLRMDTAVPGLGVPGGLSTPLNLSVARSAVWAAFNGTEQIGSLGVYIYSDAAGTQLVAQGTINVFVVGGEF